ncbi:MAG: SDR family oxidoreductase [Planctomycetota bacterium]
MPSGNRHQDKVCLVTGGAGFIGSHLVDRLIAAGHRVRVIDNLASGNLDNLAPHKNDPRLRFVEADIATTSELTSLAAGVQWFFHLAALADIVPSIEQPQRYHQANVNGTIAALEAARASGVERFVYAASSSCYGLPDQYPTPETAPCRPMYPYALTKMIGEQYVQHWQQCYGLPTASLRFFNVYGPRARTNGTYGAVFGVFLAQKLAGKAFTVVGDGKQSRDFTFVTDIASALVAAARRAAPGAIYNVGSGGTYTIQHLVELLGGPVEYVPERPGEPRCTFADTTKITEELGWQPQVSFEDGVAEMLRCIEQWREAPVWDRSSIDVATRDWFRYLGPKNETNAAIAGAGDPA